MKKGQKMIMNICINPSNTKVHVKLVWQNFNWIALHFMWH